MKNRKKIEMDRISFKEMRLGENDRLYIDKERVVLLSARRYRKVALEKGYGFYEEISQDEMNIPLTEEIIDRLVEDPLLIPQEWQTYTVQRRVGLCFWGSILEETRGLTAGFQYVACLVKDKGCWCKKYYTMSDPVGKDSLFPAVRRREERTFPDLV